jgi:hypothetical protein
MYPPSEPAGQTGGIDISGKIGVVDGNIVGRDNVLAKGDYVAGDKSHEQLVEALRWELSDKNKQIVSLLEANKCLSKTLDEINGAFGYVKMIVSRDIKLNDYIVTSVIFLKTKNLHNEYWSSVPEEARRSGGER